MKIRVRVGPRVESFVKGLAPEPRRAVRQAIKGLAQGAGDTKQLEGKLSPYCRLRVGRIRVLYELKFVEGERQAFCFFAGYRATVYEVVEQLLASGLIEALSD